jgi:hypothetical protein
MVFLSASTKFKNTWAVELEIMNGGKNNILGPIPLVFIPASSKEIIKQSEDHILTMFLEPLFRDLEAPFYNWFSGGLQLPPTSHLL